MKDKSLKNVYSLWFYLYLIPLSKNEFLVKDKLLLAWGFDKGMEEAWQKRDIRKLS